VVVKSGAEPGVGVAGVARVEAARSVGGASELSNTSALVYGSHKLEKGYKERYTPFDLALP